MSISNPTDYEKEELERQKQFIASGGYEEAERYNRKWMWIGLAFGLLLILADIASR